MGAPVLVAIAAIRACSRVQPNPGHSIHTPSKQDDDPRSSLDPCPREDGSGQCSNIETLASTCSLYSCIKGGRLAQWQSQGLHRHDMVDDWKGTST